MKQRTIFLSMVSGEFRSYHELLTNDLQRCQVAVETQAYWTQAVYVRERVTLDANGS